MMKLSLLVHCDKCGYENFPQHRFCGMCGAELPVPQATGTRPAIPQDKPPAPRETAPQPLNGPSFLGLGDEPSERERVRYLLEDDEESPRHRGGYAALIFILFVAVLALATWHWRPDLVDKFVKRSSAAGAGETESSSPSSTPAASTSSSTPSSTAPAEGSSTSSSNAIPGDQTPTAPPQASPAAAPVSGTAPASPDAGSSTATPASANPPSANSSSTASPSQPQPADSAYTAPPQESASQPAPAEKPATKPPRAKAPDASAETTTSAATGADAQEAEGEKYLYGNGVPENCGRAQRALLAAAARNNAKAQSVLGTMYATGHCIGRDLPLAYRWFGKALRQDPSNTRIEQDLKALWNQMTPDERNLALRNER